MSDDLFFHFFIENEKFRGEGKILMRHTHDTTFSEKKKRANSFSFYFLNGKSEEVFPQVLEDRILSGTPQSPPTSLL
jgi:hypothetical protein